MVSSNTTHLDIPSSPIPIVRKMAGFENGYWTNGRKEVYIISGGPSCGKTTMTDGLRERRYYIVPEASEQIIVARSNMAEILCRGTSQGMLNFRKLFIPFKKSKMEEFLP